MLYQRILELKASWFVGSVAFDEAELVVNVFVAVDDDVPLTCPTCDGTFPRYDRRLAWRVPAETPAHGFATVSQRTSRQIGTTMGWFFGFG